MAFLMNLILGLFIAHLNNFSGIVPLPANSLVDPDISVFHVSLQNDGTLPETHIKVTQQQQQPQ